MRSRVLLPFLATAVASICFGLANFQGPLMTGAEQTDRQSLILMDLMTGGRREMSLPERNIFAAAAVLEPDWTAAAEEPGFPAPADENDESDDGSTFFELRYIGYVGDDSGLVAVVLLAGSATAVRTGDYIGEDMQVGGITREEIEIIGPDSRRHRFVREGDRP